MGGMYKVGAGDCGTVAGKVYLFVQSEKESPGSWVYCKGRLYLHRTCDEAGLLRVICPETFQKLGVMKLSCSEAFKDSAAAKLNRNMPLLTDGESLYAVVVNFKAVKRTVKKERQEEYVELKRVEEEIKRKEVAKGKGRKKEEKKKGSPSDTARVCEFYLVEFDVTKHQEESEKLPDAAEEALTDELYETFSGYFSKKECMYALRVNTNDMENAGRWLIDEGENERGKTVVRDKRWVMLAQSVVQDGQETDVVEGSVLLTHYLTNGQWTMNKSQVTLHLSSPTAKVFSTREEDVKVLDAKAGEPLLGARPQQQQRLHRNDEDNDEGHEEEESEGERERRPPPQPVGDATNDFFEGIELRGSFVCNMIPEYFDYDRTAVTYSSGTNKFYVLSMDSSSICTLLEYGNMAGVNLTTMPEPLRKRFDVRSEIVSPVELAEALLFFLKESEGYRYSMPTKWNSWDTLYSKASDSLTQKLANSRSATEGAERKQEAKLTKLRKKAAQFRELQREAWIKALDLSEEKLAQTSGLAHAPPVWKAPAGTKWENVRPRLLPRGERSSSRPAFSYRGAPFGGWEESVRPPPAFAREDEGDEDDEGSNDGNTNTRSVSEPPRAKKPKKEVQVVRENLKEAAYCTAGSWAALKIIMTNLKRFREDSTGVVLHFYDQLLLWTLHSGLLSHFPITGSPEAIDDLSRHLVAIVRGELTFPKFTAEIRSYAWRIILNGWQVLVRTAELQSLLFKEATRFKPRAGINSGSYYQTMLASDTSPFELFCCKYWKYPASFYPDHAIHQSHVQCFQLSLVVEETELVAGKKGAKPRIRVKPRVDFVEMADSATCAQIEKYSSEEFSPKVSMILLPACEEIENSFFADSEITLDSRIALYSGVAVPADKSMAPRELRKHKRALLDKLRTEHNARVEEHWKILQEMLLDGLNVADGKNCDLGWLAYNNIVIHGMSELFKDNKETTAFATKVVNTMELLLARFKAATNNFSTLQPALHPWLEHFLEHLFWVSNYVHVVHGKGRYSLSMMPLLLGLLGKLREMAANLVSPTVAESELQISSESVDYTQCKVFETSHPYGRRESSRKEAFHFPDALAVSCEFDPRSRTENGNDFLSLYTNDDGQSIYSYLGTSHRFSGKFSSYNNYILVGSTVNIDFQVNSQPQKSDESGARWGFKVILRPIYGRKGRTGESQPQTSANTETTQKLPEATARKLTIAIRNLVSCATKLSRGLIKGIDLIPEEIKCKAFFDLAIVKEGIKLTKQPKLLPDEKPKADVDRDLDEEKEEIKAKLPAAVDPKAQAKDKEKEKPYKLKRAVVDPNWLKALEEVENGKGWIADFVSRVRQVVRLPENYEMERRRGSFEKQYQEKWALVERVAALSLLYHMGYPLSPEGVQVEEQDIPKIGQCLNEIIRWMLKRLSGEKEFFYLRVALLEECSKCYASFKTKYQEEQAKKLADDAARKKQEPVELPVQAQPEQPAHKEKISVSKSRSRKKRVVHMPAVPKVKPKTESKPAVAPVTKKSSDVPVTEELRISQLPQAKKVELRGKMYDSVYDMFMQRYQGNFDLVKSLCEALSIEYIAKDQPETQRKIFMRLQDSIRSIVDFELADSLPDAIPTSLPDCKSPYLLVCEHIMDRALFLLELQRNEKREQRLQMVSRQIQTLSGSSAGAGAKTPGEEQADPFAELMLMRTQSLQPFLQGADTPSQIKKAVDDYLKWKRSKVSPEDELSASDSMAKAVSVVVTSVWLPTELRRAMKVQERRGQFRELGLRYLHEIMKLYDRSVLCRLVIGSITGSLTNGPFSYIEASGNSVSRPIIDHSLRLCVSTMDGLCASAAVLDSLDSTVKKLAKDATKQAERAIMSHSPAQPPQLNGSSAEPSSAVTVGIQRVCTGLKKILQQLSDFLVLLEGSQKNTILSNLCEVSLDPAGKVHLASFFASILHIQLQSHKYLAELRFHPALVALTEHLSAGCQVVLARFAAFSAERNIKSVCAALLNSLLSVLEKECENSEPARLAWLLTILYETFLAFEVKNVDAEILQRGARLVYNTLRTAVAPCTIRIASKCAQLLLKGVPVDCIMGNGKTGDERENFVGQIVRKIGHFGMMHARLVPGEAEKSLSDRMYYVVLNLNSSEDNLMFMLTALYHLEEKFPSFAEQYPKDLQAEAKEDKDRKFKGPFDHTELFAHNTEEKAAPAKVVNPSSLANVSRQFDEIVKLTQEETKPEDPEEEKLRKLKERNYNRRISQHLSDAKALCSYLLGRSFVQYPLLLTHAQAIEVADLFEKAYNNQLTPVPSNPYMKSEAKAKKLTTGVTVEASFPLAPKPPKGGNNNNAPPPPPIVLAKARLVVSLCEKSLFEGTEKFLDSLRRGQTKCKHMQHVKYAEIDQLQLPAVVGASYSLSVQELVNLLREMLGTEANESWRKYVRKSVDSAFATLGKERWAKLSEADQELTFGSLVLVCGWFRCIRPGTEVEAVVDNSSEVCTVVAGGFGTGSGNVAVIVNGDENLNVHQIPLKLVKVLGVRKGAKEVAVDESMLIRALLNIHQECMEPHSTPGGMPEIVRLFLLKIAMETPWKRGAPDAERLMTVLADLAKSNDSEIIKHASDDKLAESWERLIEKADARSTAFYVPRRCREQKESQGTVEVGKIGGLKGMFEYVQPISSYLKSLPGKRADSHSETEAALKLLNYWEKHIIPLIQDMVRNAYKPWENLYYFEQLRDRLRKGDIDKAMEDALVICDQHLPANCVLPKDNRDWSAFVNEECIAGTWATARVELRKESLASHPMIARIVTQRSAELPVLIKAADWRIQGALCVFADPETMRCYPLLLPIDSLKEQVHPLPVPAGCYTADELTSEFSNACKELTISCALKTFVSLYNAAPPERGLKSPDVAELAHWIVMDELRQDNVEGWLSYAQPILELGIFGGKSPQVDSSLISKVLKKANRLNIAQVAENKLSRLEAHIKSVASRADLSEIVCLHKWCIDAWQSLADQINASTATMSLTDAAEVFTRADLANGGFIKGKDGNIIFPLHTYAKGKGDNGAAVITFEISAFLSPNSKLKFYSDPFGQNLVYQINVGKSPIQSIPPIVINHGKVWCHFHQGTTANLSIAQQEKTVPSSLPCCITLIPAAWTTACWLTETLTTCLLEKPELKTLDQFYKPLLTSLCRFVTKSSAPNMLKQLSFVLINRILRKMRYVYNVNPYVAGSCLDKLGLDKEWLTQLIDEIGKLRDNEDHGEDSTYSEFIQNAAELVASTLLPFKTSTGAEEPADVQLVEQLHLPAWLRSVLNVAIFLNFFRKDGQLTKELSREVFSSMRIEDQSERILLLHNLPAKFTHATLRVELLKFLTSNKVRIMNPDTDVIIPKADAPGDQHKGIALVITDGFDLSYEQAVPPEEKKEEAKEPEEEKKEEAPPSDWDCPECTLKNPAANATCEACGTNRPVVAVPPPPLKPKVKDEAQLCEKAMWDKLEEKIKELGVEKKEVPPEDLEQKEESKTEHRKEGKKEDKKRIPQMRKPKDKAHLLKQASDSGDKKEKEKPKKKEDKKKEENKKESDKKEPDKKEEKKDAEPEAPKVPPEPVVEVIRGLRLVEPNIERMVYEALRERIVNQQKTELLPQVKSAVHDVYERLTALCRANEEISLLPREHQFYAEVGLSKERLGTMKPEEMCEAVVTLAELNPWLVWEFLAHHGYDLWCMKGGFSSAKEFPGVFVLPLLEDMITMCEVEICKETKMVMHMSPSYLRFAPIGEDPLKVLNGIDESRLRLKYRSILSARLDEVRYNWGILKNFNDNLKSAIPYINWTMCVNLIPENSVPLTISSFLSASRKLCLNYVKMCLQQAVLNQTAVVRESPPKLVFERLKLGGTGKKHSKAESPTSEKAQDSIKTLAESMFYQAFEQMKKIDLTLMRPPKPEGSAPFLAFEIIFKGEYVVGEGGPYRQFFADMSTELQPSATSGGYADIFSTALRLLCPTPNTVNKQGEAKDKYTLTPAAKSTTELLLYEFLGILMGCCIRTGVRFSLDLPALIWKQIVGEPLTLADLEEVDKSVVGMLQYIIQPQLTAEEFNSVFTETFTALLSDMSSVELLPGGNSVPVTYERRKEYAELLLRARLAESELQCQAVRKGISLVVPVALLNFLTHQEIADVVCGRPTVDLEMLKRHARYGKGLNENSDRVKFLWEVLQELSEPDKLKFIKFCWGQERLPANDEEYERRQVRFMVKPSVRKGNDEQALPKADTCFFNLELPNYRTKEMLKQKLLLAIHTDFVSMNAEDNPALDPRSSPNPMEE